MCGRFTQSYTWDQLHEFMELHGPAQNLQPRYNIAPTTWIDVICPHEKGRKRWSMRWGIIPSWWKKPLSELPSTFNARAETVAVKPMFRSAFKHRRCIIPASGFYEWTGEKGHKTPHYFSSSDGKPLLFAGLWEDWHDPETKEQILSATIIVGPANEWMSPYHDRMPIILSHENADDWFLGEHPENLLHPSSNKALQQWIVSPRVNKAGVGDDDPSLLYKFHS